MKLLRFLQCCRVRCLTCLTFHQRALHALLATPRFNSRCWPTRDWAGGWVKYNADVPVSTSLPNALTRFSQSRQPTDQLASPPLDRSALGLPRSANCTLHYNLIMQHFAERAEAKDEAGSDMDKAAQCTDLWPPRATALPLRSNMGWFKPRRYAPVA